jgi:hypothetical protein
MSYTTQNEFAWNTGINRELNINSSNFLFTKNYDSGHFGSLFYMIVKYQEGDKLADRPNPGYEHPDFENYLDDVIDMSEFIRDSKVDNLNPDGDERLVNFQ